MWSKIFLYTLSPANENTYPLIISTIPVTPIMECVSRPTLVINLDKTLNVVIVIINYFFQLMEDLNDIMCKDASNLVLDYLHESGHNEPFDIPLQSTIRCQYMYLPYTSMFLGTPQYCNFRQAAVGFQMPGPKSEEWDIHWTVDENGNAIYEDVELVYSSTWQWVKIMECVGICDSLTNRCKCAKKPSTNWYLLEIRPNGQSETVYILMSDVEIIKRSADRNNVEIVYDPCHVLLDV